VFMAAAHPSAAAAVRSRLSAAPGGSSRISRRPLLPTQRRVPSFLPVISAAMVSYVERSIWNSVDKLQKRTFAIAEFAEFAAVSQSAADFTRKISDGSPLRRRRQSLHRRPVMTNLSNDSQFSLSSLRSLK
jgi:hypothetical protein